MRLIDADGTIEKLKNTLNMLEEDLLIGTEDEEE